MGDQIISGGVSVALAIVGLAILAVLVSRNAQTGDVISAAASGFAADLSAAVSPVTGGGGGFGFGGFSGQGRPIGSIPY
jgi:hypothetical protein